MGNQGSILIETDRVHYNPGDTVKGTVTIELEKAVACSGLYLTLKGKEKTRKVEDNNSYRGSKQVRTTTTYTSTRELVDDTVCLFEVSGDGPVAPGTYTYPFSFELDSDLPSSFQHRGMRCQGSIKYKLKAEFEVNGSMTRNWRQTKEVFIFESTGLYEEHPVSENEERVIKFLGCFSRGMATIDAKIPTNCFVGGETISVNADVIHKGNVKAIKAELVRHIRIRAERKEDFHKKIIAQATAPSNQGEVLLELSIPEELKYPSTDGEYVQVWYEVVVRGVVSWSRDPKIELPVIVCYDK